MNIFVPRVRPLDVVLRFAVVGLALSTGYIHSTLGGVLYTLNAVGYLVLAVAQVVPLGPLSSYRWVARLALAGFAATTIVGWYFMGARYFTAYLAKAIELVLISVLTVEVYRLDGGPRGIVAKIRATLGLIGGLVTGRRAGVASA